MSSSETPETCTKAIGEYCRLHPVDCPNCANDDGCQMKETMQAHSDVIKRCRFFRPQKVAGRGL